MEPTNLERTNLEAHVDLCAQRYNSLDLRLGVIETKIEQLNDTLERNKSSVTTTVITAAAGIISSVIGLIITILMTF